MPSQKTLQNFGRPRRWVLASVAMSTAIDTAATTEIQNGRLRILLRSAAEGFAGCSGTCGACCCYEKEESA